MTALLRIVAFLLLAATLPLAAKTREPHPGTNELLRELRKQGYDKPVIGETTLANDKVIELAGEAANGVVAHVGLTPDAPNPTVQAFAKKYQAEFKSKPDHNAMKGYTGMHAAKAIFDKISIVWIGPLCMDRRSQRTILRWRPALRRWKHSSRKR